MNKYLRAEEIVPKRTLEMIEAIKEKDFSKFAQITIKDSNQFHAVCQVSIKRNRFEVSLDTISSPSKFPLSENIKNGVDDWCLILIHW